MNTNNIYKIDASGRALGRVASEAAAVLQGKHEVTFARHKAGSTRVEITNAGALRMSPAKLKVRDYTRYSGYPGGLRHTSLADIITKKGAGEPLRLAIRGMLPRNKLRSELMKHLTINS